MSKIYTSADQLIGHTPLLELKHIESNDGLNATILAKLEYFNPAGSVKDRIAKSMIDDAEAAGKLKPGAVIIEPTSGNTGIGLASVAAARGYRIILVMPETMSVERRQLMKAYGAELVLTEGAKGMKGAIAKANELAASIDGSFIPGQFVNPANPKAHRESTGPEIYMDLDGNLDYFVAGAGSGGTFTGIVRFLKAHIPHLKAVLADPVGSTLGGGSHADYNIEGIGNDFVADTFDISLVDQAIKVSDDEAFDGSKKLARFEGIFAGSSSGAALSAALKLIDQGARGNIVFILPDRGDRYFSKNLYDQVD